MQARHALGSQDVDPSHAGDGEKDTQRASGNCEQEILREQLAHNARTAGSQGRPHADFLLTGRCPRERKIGDLGAGDQQHAPDRAQEQEQHAPDIVDYLVQKRHDVERQAAIGRICFPDSPGAGGP